MKIIAISDLHGHLPKLPRCDLLIVAGDICGQPYYPEHVYIAYQILWYERVFLPWLATIDAVQKVVIGGNHDIIFNFPELIERGEHLLLNDKVDYAGWNHAPISSKIKLYGTPWTAAPQFPWPYEWVFNADEARQAVEFVKIPDDVEILITHGPPYGTLDAPSPGSHCGSRALADRVAQLKKLKLHVFGHFHGCFGVERVGDHIAANVSYLDAAELPRLDGWLEIDL